MVTLKKCCSQKKLLSFVKCSDEHSSHLSHFRTKQLSVSNLSETISKSMWGNLSPSHVSRLYGFVLKSIDFAYENLPNSSKCDHTFALKCKNCAGANKALESLMLDSLAEFAVVTCLYSVFAKGVNLLAIKCSLLLQYLCLSVGLHRRGASLL